MARRYSDKEKAAIWALHCQNKGPTEIMRILNADDSPLGYAMSPPLPRRSCQIILRRLEEKLGPPVATIKPGEENDAIDAIRREGLAAIRRRVAELTNKQDLGEELTAAEVRTLNAAVLAADGAARRARDIDKPRAIGNGGAPAANASGSSSLLGAMSRALDDAESVPDGPLIKANGEGDVAADVDAEDGEDADAGEAAAGEAVDVDDGADSLAPPREHAVA